MYSKPRAFPSCLYIFRRTNQAFEHSGNRLKKTYFFFHVFFPSVSIILSFYSTDIISITSSDHLFTKKIRLLGKYSVKTLDICFTNAAFLYIVNLKSRPYIDFCM